MLQGDSLAKDEKKNTFLKSRVTDVSKSKGEKKKKENINGISCYHEVINSHA